jgi:hypothetical protein
MGEGEVMTNRERMEWLVTSNWDRHIKIWHFYGKWYVDKHAATLTIDRKSFRSVGKAIDYAAGIMAYIKTGAR